MPLWPYRCSPKCGVTGHARIYRHANRVVHANGVVHANRVVLIWFGVPYNLYGVKYHDLASIPCTGLLRPGLSFCRRRRC